MRRNKSLNKRRKLQTEGILKITRCRQSLLKVIDGNSLVVQRLGIHTFTAGGTNSIPGWGTEILHATQTNAHTQDEHFGYSS